MSDAVDIVSLSAAAAEAASQNDPAAAEVLLRLALDMQTAASGPDHLDLASTLNNLALMLERQGKTAEAERCYRRAYDIARRGAPPDDEIVVVSRENLIAFLKSTDVENPIIDEPAPKAPVPMAQPTPPASRIEPLMPAPSKAAPRPAAVPSSPPPQVRPQPTPQVRPARERSIPAPPLRPAREKPTPAPPAASARSGDSLMWLVVLAAVAGLVAAWLVVPRPENVDAPGEGADAEPSTSVAEPPSVAPTPTPPAAGSTPPPATAGKAPSAVDPAPPTPARTEPSPASIVPTDRTGVSADGRLCTSLTRGGEWRCDAAGDRLDSDVVYYYTRVRTPRDAVVRHRWTYQGEVVRTVNLQVRANAEPGYRTYSRQVLTGRDPGWWEVALLAPDGTVIDSRKFTTR